MHRLRIAGLAAVMTAFSLPARAWQIADPIHHNCHEQLAAGALASVGYLPYAPPSTELTHDQSAFLDDGDYTYQYDRNMQAAAFITGIRSNDLDGSADFDFNTLAPVHNNPTDQGAHCLRAASDQGDPGNVTAMASCMAFITAQFNAALVAADGQGVIDVSKTEPVSVYMPFEGTIAFPLSTFWYHAGRGMHAIQDSFTHQFRDSTWRSPQSICNWVDQVRGDLVESVNGHGHEKELDDCTSQRPSRPAEQAAAEQASVEFLALMTAQVDPTQRQVLFQQFLARWFTLERGCNLNNAYCNNAVYGELKERWSSDYPTAESTGCGSGSSGSLWALSAVLVWALRSRRRAGALFLAAVLWGGPRRASADEPRSDDPPGPRVTALAALSVDSPAFAYGGGVMWQFESWELGIGAEHNPWVTLDQLHVSMGALNFYGRVGWRRPLSSEFSYRAGVDLGAATLLVNTVGSSPGQVGAYLGVDPLSVIYHPPGRIEYEVSAFTVSVPEIQFRGWPFGYPQYRVTFGMRFH